MSTAFDDFLENIGRYPLLTPTEEIELARLIQAWLPLRNRTKLSKSEQRTAMIGRRAYDKFFCANLRLVVFAAKRYMIKSKSMTIDDLVQEGCMGLARSIEKFDPERGYKFSTYAYWWIRQSIARGLEAYDRMIKLPVVGVQTLGKLRKFTLEFYRKNGRYPSKTECIEHCDVSVHLFNAYIAHMDGCSSLNAKCNSENHASELIDVVIDHDRSLEESIERSMMHEHLQRWMLSLSHEERDLLTKHYGLDNSSPMSLQDIGTGMYLSREAIRHKENVIINKLRIKARAYQ
jgi:RNA polymerase primary sigma factor